MSQYPIIGVTMDREEEGGYSRYPWLALRENYAHSIEACGGIPIGLPPTEIRDSCLRSLLSRLDGLVITGGAFDIDPAYYNEEMTSDRVVTKPARTRFEMAITHLALQEDKPVLGICGGQQLLHVLLGGRLVQHIPDRLQHEQTEPRHLPSHEVIIEPDSILARITKAQRISVNSAHHQAADGPPEKGRVSARAPDGIIEAIENPDYRFCLGVQWHPEFGISAADKAIFQAFIAAC